MQIIKYNNLGGYAGLLEITINDKKLFLVCTYRKTIKEVIDNLSNLAHFHLSQTNQ
jgi:hypothetical protein